MVSIDPRRVYINSPDDVPFKSIKVTNPGKIYNVYLIHISSITCSLRIVAK